MILIKSQRHTYTIEVINRFAHLATEGETPEELWKQVKTITLESAKKHVPKKKKEKRTLWLSQDAIRIAGERRIIVK